jgi:hypothetical protein
MALPKNLYIVYCHKAVTMNHFSCLDTKLDLVCGIRNLWVPLPFYSFNTTLTAVPFCPENRYQSLMDGFRMIIRHTYFAPADTSEGST